jgi:hypothetical protein
MKRLIQWIVSRILPSLSVTLFTLWWFQPTIFNMGIQKINWIIIVKVMSSVFAAWWFIYSIVLTNEQRKNRESKSTLKHVLNNLSAFEKDLLLDIYDTKEKYKIRDFDTGNRQYHCYKSFAIEGIVTIETLMNANQDHQYDTVKIILTKEVIEILDKAEITKAN